VSLPPGMRQEVRSTSGHRSGPPMLPLCATSRLMVQGDPYSITSGGGGFAV
jgi:hypothetical protein